MMIGTWLCLRISLQRVSPSMPGSMMSSTTRSGLSWPNRARACVPSPTPSTSYPSREKYRRASSRMCASSSTTRTLKLKPAIPSIHHHPVIRMSGWRERNVNELALAPACSALVRTFAQYELQRVALQAEPHADRLLQVPPVREMQQPDVVDEHDHRGRFGGRLGCVAKLEAAALEARGRVVGECLTEDLVQLVGRHLDAPMADDLEGCRDHRGDALFRLGRNGDDRSKGRELEASRQLCSPVRGFALGGLDQVDLVDYDDQALARFERVARDVLVLGKRAGRCVYHQQHGVSPLHRVDSAQEAVLLEAIAGGRLAANAGRVDEDHRYAIEDDFGVDGVARRAGRWAHQGALVTQQRVQQ